MQKLVGSLSRIRYPEEALESVIVRIGTRFAATAIAASPRRTMCTSRKVPSGMGMARPPLFFFFALVRRWKKDARRPGGAVLARKNRKRNRAWTTTPPSQIFVNDEGCGRRRGESDRDMTAAPDDDARRTTEKEELLPVKDRTRHYYAYAGVAVLATTAAATVYWSRLQRMPAHYANLTFPADHELVCATRISTRCKTPPYSEGLGSGYNDQRPNTPYGCWFSISTAADTRVDVRRSLRASSRRQMADMLGSECDDMLCSDMRWCERARALGYDSLMIAKQPNNPIFGPELVLCYGDCMTRPLDGACPPVALYGVNGSRCACNADSKVLTCEPTVHVDCSRAPSYLMHKQQPGRCSHVIRHG